MLLRAQNLVGYRNYADNMVPGSLERAIREQEKALRRDYFYFPFCSVTASTAASMPAASRSSPHDG